MSGEERWWQKEQLLQSPWCVWERAEGEGTGEREGRASGRRWHLQWQDQS